MTGRRTYGAIAAWCLAATLLAAGVSAVEPAPKQSAKSKTRKPSKEAAPAGKGPANEDFVAFAQALEEAIDAGDARAFEKYFDPERMVDITLKGLDLPAPLREELLKGLRQGPEEDGSFAAQIMKAAANGGSYRLLRVHRVDGAPRALFRLILPDDGGFNYHDIVIEPALKGQLRAVDVYTLGSGELLTATMRRLILENQAALDPKKRPRLEGRDAEFIKALPVRNEMLAAIAKRDYASAIKRFEKLPESIQLEKSTLLPYLMAAAAADSNKLKSGIERFRAKYPNDPSVDMVSLNWYLLEKKYAEYQKAVDRIDQSVGGDPYLEIVRANALVEQQDYAQAKTRLTRAVKADSDLVDAWWSLVLVSLRERDFAETTRLLDRIAEEFGIDVNELPQNEEYAEFVKSAEYKKWRKPKTAAKDRTKK
jgi:tetratricopeptide (TPR) repeat protein